MCLRKEAQFAAEAHCFEANHLEQEQLQSEVDSCFQKLSSAATWQDHCVISMEYKKLRSRGDCGTVGAEISSALSKEAGRASEGLAQQVGEQVRFPGCWF